MTDLTIASPIASTAPIDRTPVATAGTPLTFRTVRQRWPLLILLAVLVPLVLGALAMVDGGRFLFWDAPLTAAAVDHRGTVIDNLSLAVSRLGAWPVVYPLGAALALAAARRSSRLAWIIVATVAARPAVEWLLKEIVERPRPDGARLVAGTGFSFPSGHVLAAIATWAFLPAVVALYTRRRSLWWASVGVAGSVVALVAWSRVWLGVHWTSDVVASLALGYLAFNAVEAWLQRGARDDTPPGRRRAELLPEVGPVIPALQPITRSDPLACVETGGRPMTPRQVGITVDCADAAHLAAFWERFLGYTRRSAAPGSPYVTIDRGDDGPDGPPFLTFQTVPEPKKAKVRLHLDLFVDRARPYVDEMLAAGASSVSRTEAGEWTTRVLQDPAGNEFCVIGPD